MQAIQDLISRNQQMTRLEKSSTQNTDTSHQNPHNAILVWDIFSQLYGVGFTSSFGFEPSRIWIEELAQLSPQDVQRGVNASKRSGSDFAPSLPKFLKLCEPPIVEDVYRHERETQLLLERRRNVQSTPEVRSAELEKMKADLWGFKVMGEDKKPQPRTVLSPEEAAKKQAAMIEAAQRLLEQDSQSQAVKIAEQSQQQEQTA